MKIIYAFASSLNEFSIVTHLPFLLSSIKHRTKISRKTALSKPRYLKFYSVQQELTATREQIRIERSNLDPRHKMEYFE